MNTVPRRDSSHPFLVYWHLEGESGDDSAQIMRLSPLMVEFQAEMIGKSGPSNHTHSGAGLGRESGLDLRCSRITKQWRGAGGGRETQLGTSGGLGWRGL